MYSQVALQHWHCGTHCPGLFRSLCRCNSPLSYMSLLHEVATLSKASCETSIVCIALCFLQNTANDMHHSYMRRLPSDSTAIMGTVVLQRTWCYSILYIQFCTQALKCIWQLIEGNHACQQRLLEASVPSLQGKPAPAVLVSLPVNLHAPKHILCFVACCLAVARAALQATCCAAHQL